MAILFDAFGAIVVWLVLFKMQLLGTLTTTPLSQTLSKLTFFDVFMLAVCFFVVSLISRLVEKHAFRRKKEKALN
jgi:antibiotic biosynthesis monooxygenase (ABM) superfamily enzyme